MEPIIMTDNIRKSFGKGEALRQVLNGADLCVERGEFVSLMGSSGSGKSTLLYLIGGLDTEYEGSITVCGRRLEELKEREMSALRREKIGFVFQFYNLVQNLNVVQNITLPVRMSRRKMENAEKKLAEILEITGLSDKRKAKPAQLSGGQQQRVSIARAVFAEPELLLADEPTGNLDDEATEEIMSLFQRINREKGISILQVTHSQSCAEKGSRIVRLDGGRLTENIPKITVAAV